MQRPVEIRVARGGCRLRQQGRNDEEGEAGDRGALAGGATASLSAAGPAGVTEVPRFGTRGRLDYDEHEDALLCHVCGRWKRNLAQHARLAHGLGADEYRELAGLNRTTRLITPSMRARLREAAAPTIERLRAEGRLRRWDEDPEKFRRDKAAAVAVIRRGMSAEAREHRRSAVTPERRQAQSERRRERNLLGLDRASPEAISAGLHAAAGEGACHRCGQGFQRTVPRQLYCWRCGPEVERERGRESKRRARLRRKLGESATPRRAPPPAKDTTRDATCPRCRQTFRADSHRDKYCPPCRPAAIREYQRRWKARRRTEQVEV